ncbi:hypothetical protein BGZ81_007209 [Podila clonocystis]|nr:hypothetical protein BGZ81_007209 [Podila clonocystis]
MFNHDYPQDEDTNIDHPSDSSGTEIYDMWQYHDQNASHTASEHASVSLLLASPARTPSLTPLERHASPSPSPAPAPPSQLPAAKDTHCFQKSSRAQKNALKQAKKPALKRTTNKRKDKEPVVRAARRQKRVKWAESAATVSNDHEGDHEDDHGDESGVDDNDDDDEKNEDENEDEDEDEDSASEHSLVPETPMPVLPPASIPHSHLHFLAHHVHMAPPLHFLPGLEPYLHSRMAYHDLRTARDILFFQYNAAARKAVAEGEPWGFLWFNSDYMEQSAASALVEFKRLSLAPAPAPSHVVPMHPVVVPHSHLQPEFHAHCDGCAECYY